MPATAAGANQRSRALQAMGGGQDADGLGAGRAVDVQDVEGVAGGQADVGLGVAGPPGQDPGPVGGGVVDAMGDEAAQGVLANPAAAQIPTRAARSRRRTQQRSVAGNRPEVAVVGEGVVQGQHRDAAGGIAECGDAQQPARATHLRGSAAGGRWRCRKLAALLRPQPAASARVRAVQGCPSGRGWAYTVWSRAPTVVESVGRGPAGSARRWGPGAAVASRRSAVGSLRWTVVACRSWPGCSCAPARSRRAACAARRVTSPASPLRPSSMASTARGLAGASWPSG